MTTTKTELSPPLTVWTTYWNADPGGLDYENRSGIYVLLGVSDDGRGGQYAQLVPQGYLMEAEPSFFGEIDGGSWRKPFRVPLSQCLGRTPHRFFDFTPPWDRDRSTLRTLKLYFGNAVVQAEQERFESLGTTPAARLAAWEREFHALQGAGLLSRDPSTYSTEPAQPFHS